MATWPPTVPSVLQNSGYSHDAESGVIRTDMDTGPAKTRRRFTAVTENHSGSIIMTKTQFATWKTWFVNTIMQGTLPFDMTDPLTGDTVSMRIVVDSGAPYKFAPESGTDYGVLSLKLEKLP